MTVTEAAMLDAVSGNSLMTVLSPIEEMSLNCSLSAAMLEHKCSTIVSTWTSFTLVTNGPKLSISKHVNTQMSERSYLIPALTI